MSTRLAALLAPCLLVASHRPDGAPPSHQPSPEHIVVDGRRGRDSNPGTSSRPLRSLSAAIGKLGEPLAESVTIELRGEQAYAATGGVGMPDDQLQLAVRMRPGVEVRIVGTAEVAPPVLAWNGRPALILVTEGRWRLERLQVGAFTTEQRRGVMVDGPAEATLRDVTIRTRSHSDAGIWASRGAHVSLSGAIHLNEQLHDEADEESFCGIFATEHATVKFDERDGASLEIGNGQLSASYYGCIRLGCASARITSWTKGNNIAVNDSGRVDFHGTTARLCAKLRENTPIGPEHDGHILAEDAHIVILGENDCAIALQKASTFTCNDIELKGTFRKTLWVMSGSMFVGRFLGDVSQVEVHTGGGAHIEAVKGKVVGPLIATSGGLISLPDGTIRVGGK